MHFCIRTFLFGFLLFFGEQSVAAAPGDRMSYRGDVRPSFAESTLQADLQVSVPMRTSQQNIAFFINRGLKVDELSGTGVSSFSRMPMEGNPLWSLLEIEVDADVVGSELKFHISYSGKPIFPNDDINGIGLDWIELSVDSAWYPVLSSLAYPVTAEISIDLPEQWTIVTSGQTSRSGNRWLLMNTIPQPDIAWTGAPNLVVHGDHEIRVFHRGLHRKVVDQLVDRTSACKGILEERFAHQGSLPPLRLVVAGRDESGYARKNYIVLSRVEDRPEIELTKFLCHELSHFWSGGAPPLSVDNWMNEGFAVLMAADAVGSLYSEAAFRELLAEWRKRAISADSIWTPENPSRRSHAVNYFKAPLFLSRLRACMGPRSFEKLILRYVSEPINSTEHLLDEIEDLMNTHFRVWTVQQLGMAGEAFIASKSCPLS